MNALVLIAYVLIVLAIVRLISMRGRCPTAWVVLAIGVGILWHRGKLNV
jgi:hypothetical protein